MKNIYFVIVAVLFMIYMIVEIRKEKLSIQKITALTDYRIKMDIKL